MAIKLALEGFGRDLAALILRNRVAEVLLALRGELAAEYVFARLFPRKWLLGNSREWSDRFTGTAVALIRIVVRRQVQRQAHVWATGNGLHLIWITRNGHFLFLGPKFINRVRTKKAQGLFVKIRVAYLSNLANRHTIDASLPQSVVKLLIRPNPALYGQIIRAYLLKLFRKICAAQSSCIERLVRVLEFLHHLEVLLLTILFPDGSSKNRAHDLFLLDCGTGPL